MERKEAIKFGHKKYDTGRPCRHGHMSERYADSGACISCLRNSASIKHASSADAREVIASQTKQIYLFTRLEGLAAIKLMIDSMVNSRLPDLDPAAVNPEPYWQKRISKYTYQIKVRVPHDDVAEAYKMGKFLLEPEELK